MNIRAVYGGLRARCIFPQAVVGDDGEPHKVSIIGRLAYHAIGLCYEIIRWDARRQA